MLFSLTRQTKVIVSLIVGFFCFSALLGVVCIFISTPIDRSEHHLTQAKFYQDKHDIGGYHSMSSELLFLSEKELLASLFVNPYQGDVWNVLVGVAKAENKHAVANIALRFSHKFSNNKTLNLAMKLAYNDVANRRK